MIISQNYAQVEVSQIKLVGISENNTNQNGCQCEMHAVKILQYEHKLL